MAWGVMIVFSLDQLSWKCRRCLDLQLTQVAIAKHPEKVQKSGMSKQRDFILRIGEVNKSHLRNPSKSLVNSAQLHADFPEGDRKRMSANAFNFPTLLRIKG